MKASISGRTLSFFKKFVNSVVNKEDPNQKPQPKILKR